MPLFRKEEIDTHWNNSPTRFLEPGTVYSHNDLVAKLKQARPGLSSSGYHWLIADMTNAGVLTHQSRGEYSLAQQNPLPEYHPIYSDEADKMIHLISAQYPHLQFTVFETALLNDFLNHLVAQNTIFIQVEKESSVFVFRWLQEQGLQNLMYKPTQKEFNLYWSAGCIVVTDLISEAPILPTAPHMIMLEKMLVDMCANKLIKALYSKAELPDVFDRAIHQFKLDQKKMLRYARRRSKEADIKKYLGG